MKTRMDLKLAGKQLSTKTEIQSFGRVLFFRTENRNFSLFHFCTTGKLVYVDTIWSFEADSYDCGKRVIEPRPTGCMIKIFIRGGVVDG